MPEIENYPLQKKETIAKTVKYGILLAVIVGGIGLAVNLTPHAITALEKELTIKA